MKTVILLSGKKSTGKDTAAKHIQDLLGEGHWGTDVAAIKSFADPLKKFCIDVLGLDENQCYGESVERNGYTDIRWADISLKLSMPHAAKWKDVGKWDAKLQARDILQIVGTDVLRNFYENIWARAATISALKTPKNFVIFSDTRFPNEVLEFQKLEEENKIKLIVVRIVRPGLPHDNHPSEVALDRWDDEGRFKHIITNDKSLKVFKTKIANLMKKVGVIIPPEELHTKNLIKDLQKRTAPIASGTFLLPPTMTPF